MPASFRISLRDHMGYALILLIVIGGFLATAPAAQAQDTLFASRLTDLHSDDGRRGAIATLSPGTPLTVLAQSGDAVQVEITGWSPEGAEQYLFPEMGQRILLAKLTKRGVAAVTVISQQEDYYESVWNDVSLTGWIARQDTTDDVAAIWTTARDLFHHRCTRCHALHRPTEFKANQWPSILKIMTVRAGLSGNDRALIVQYLQTHAKDQTPPDAAEEEADDTEIQPIDGNAEMAQQGATLFEDNGCAACHGDDADTPADLGYPRLAGQAAEYVFKQLQDFKTTTRTNDLYEMMQGSVADLSDDDARAIAYWLSTLSAK